jgi:hypothetical protein
LKLYVPKVVVIEFGRVVLTEANPCPSPRNIHDLETEGAVLPWIVAPDTFPFNYGVRLDLGELHVGVEPPTNVKWITEPTVASPAVTFVLHHAERHFSVVSAS